jgi:hypothetical protein
VKITLLGSYERHKMGGGEDLLATPDIRSDCAATHRWQDLMG